MGEHDEGPEPQAEAGFHQPSCSRRLERLGGQTHEVLLSFCFFVCSHRLSSVIFSLSVPRNQGPGGRRDGEEQQDQQAGGMDEDLSGVGAQAQMRRGRRKSISDALSGMAGKMTL